MSQCYSVAPFRITFSRVVLSLFLIAVLQAAITAAFGFPTVDNNHSNIYVEYIHITQCIRCISCIYFYVQGTKVYDDKIFINLAIEALIHWHSYSYVLIL